MTVQVANNLSEARQQTQGDKRESEREKEAERKQRQGEREGEGGKRERERVYSARCQVINLISFWSTVGRRPVPVQAQASDILLLLPVVLLLLLFSLLVLLLLVVILSSVSTCDYAWCVCQFPHFPVPGGCHD